MFEEIVPYKRIKDMGHKVILSHYPFASWDCKHYGSIHLHGHVHGRPMEGLGRAYDVGVDVRNFMTVTLEELVHMN